MKAAQINDYGDASAININEIAKPEIAEGQVLVEVYSSSINPFDTTLRSGKAKAMIPLKFPATLGGDIAGVVAEVGSGADGFRAGDKVYGQANLVAGGSGAFAEFAATAAGQIAAMPEGISYDQAASLPLVGVSAWQALTQHIKLAAGQKVFIHGGAGGIGTIAIQIAKHIGAYVATTASGDGIDIVKRLGADEIIDYKTQDFSESLKDFDAVYDTVGGNDFNISLGVLKRGGTAVSMIAQADPAKAADLGVAAVTQQTKVTTEALSALRTLVEEGAVAPQVGKIFPLSQIKEAFEARESGKVTGKVVVEIR